jgi:predicted O-methyltransferase YrrM
MNQMAMSEYIQLVDEHFASLGSTDVLDLGDGFSRLLRPDRCTGTALDHITKAFAEVLVGSKLAQWRHVNHHTFSCLFSGVAQLIEHPIILETGSSAHGVNSSMLFASLASKADGRFDTVDLNSETVQRVSAMMREKFGQDGRISCHLGDSATFIENYTDTPNVVYLDSFDLNPGHFTESAAHGLLEFANLVPKLDSKCALILVDDTPRTREIFRKMCPADYLLAVDRHVSRTGRLPGKGELIIESIRKDRRFQILEWEYQLLLLYRP